MVKIWLKHLTMLALFAWAAAAHAGILPFNQAQFDRAMAAGKPVVVYFHADWCPTCRVQQPIVARIARSPEMKDLTVFVADYDKETALEKTLHVVQQSTFVVFRAGREVARSTGQTTEPAIRDTWRKAL